MIYLALTFWLLVTVFTAWGVHKLWTGMVKERVVNLLLLPGTLVAQIGHVLGLLVTGATITNTSLLKDDESAAPETTTNPEPRIPVIGPVVIGLLPLLACGAAIYFVARTFGQPVMAPLAVAPRLGPQLPMSLSGFWELLRDQITLMESLTRTVAASNFHDWRTWAFLYLLTCLAIRTAPFPGNLRGALGAIVLLGVGAAAISSLFDVADPRVQTGWAVLSLTIATLLILLLTSLMVRGGVGLVQLLRNEAA